MSCLLWVFRTKACERAREGVIHSNLESSGGGAVQVEWDIGLVAAFVFSLLGYRRPERVALAVGGSSDGMYVGRAL
jgi:hypothetical protein